MSELFFLNKEENISLLININNGSINSALVHFSSKKAPKFLYSTENYFIGEKTELTKFSNEASFFLEACLRDIINNGWKKINLKNKKIERIIVSISSPWFVLKTKNLHLSQNHTFIITRRFINDILKKEEDLFKKELSQHYLNKNQEEFNIIEKSAIHTKINGYSVENILSRKTKNFDVSIFISAVTKKIEEKITNIIFKETHIQKENLIMHSFPMILFSTIRDHFSTDSNFLLLNIDSELTDVILIEDHVIKSIISFPFGKNTIIRRLSKSFKISSEIAESKLTMYLSNKIDDTNLDPIYSLLEDLEKEWSVYFENALLKLSPNLIWPKKTFIMVNKNVSEIFVNFLSLQKKDTISSFRKHIDIKLIDETIFSNLYLKTFNKEINTSLLVLAIFYNKLLNLQ